MCIRDSYNAEEPVRLQPVRDSLGTAIFRNSRMALFISMFFFVWNPDIFPEFVSVSRTGRPESDVHPAVLHSHNKSHYTVIAATHFRDISQHDGFGTSSLDYLCFCQNHRSHHSFLSFCKSGNKYTVLYVKKTKYK